MGALKYTIDTDARIVRLHYTDSPDWPEMKETLIAVLADPAFRPGFGVLADRSQVETPQTAGYIRNILAFVRKHQKEFGYSRWALVAKGAAPYGMGRMAQALGEDIFADLELFRDPVEAERWLIEHRDDPPRQMPGSGPPPGQAPPGSHGPTGSQER